MNELEEMQKTKTEINHFGNWIKSVPEGDYKAVREVIILKCKITPQIFKHWKCGNSKVPVLAQEKINEIAGYNIFNKDVP